MKRFLLSIMLAVIVWGAGYAQTRDENWMLCDDDNPDVRLRGCTAVIDAGRETPGSLAAAYYNRAVAYDMKGQREQALADYSRAIDLDPNAEAFNNRAGIYRLNLQNDLAIADYDKAIALAPDEAKIFNNRGIVRRAENDNDQAFADFDRAIKLDPNSAVAFFSRGVTYFYLGQFASAADDLAQSVRLDPSDAYSVLWLHLARGKAGMADRDELARSAAGLDLGAWPGAVVNLYLGKATPDQVRTAVMKADGAEAQADQACEAAFYAGENEVLARHPAEAKALLQQAANSCPQTFEEYLGATAELRRLH